MSLKKYPTNYIKVNGEEIAYHLIDNDVYGKPRYVVHFLALGIESSDYGRIPGLKKYRANWFGGGIVFVSFSLERDLARMMEQVKAYYNKEG